MLVLALDTSADIAVALLAADDRTRPDEGTRADDGTRPDAPGSAGSARSPGAADGAGGPVLHPLAQRRFAEQRRHAELLAPMITQVLDDAGADRRDVGAVVVGTGPAPFTGLRAGLVTARTLSFALGIPCHGVCSLDALAAQAFARGLARRDDAGHDVGQHDREHDVLVATDARRGELYVARYRRARDRAGDVELVEGPQVVRPADLAARPAAHAVVGAGALLYPDHVRPTAGAPTVPDPAVLAGLALRRSAGGAELPTEPLYLRRPDVTPATGRRRVT